MALRLQSRFEVSERRACQVIGLARSTVQYEPAERTNEEKELVSQIRKFALEHPRYGYRRIWVLLKEQGWQINKKKVRRLWREEGLKVPAKQLKKRRIKVADADKGKNSCHIYKPERKNHVWSYDFLTDQTADFKQLRFLNIIDEFTRENLTIQVGRQIKAKDVIDTLATIIKERGAPEYIRSDNGPEFIAKKVQNWLSQIGTTTLYIDPGEPWQNGYIEAFNARFRDEHLDQEIFFTLKEAQVLANQWAHHYNQYRPHSSLNNLPPARYAERIQQHL